MIRILQAAHPGVFIDNEIIEPNAQHVAAYRGEAVPAARGVARAADLRGEACCRFVKFLLLLVFFFKTELVNQAPDLQNVSFIWHQLTSLEYEQQVKEKGAHKKFDFIHMIQVMEHCFN